MKKVAILQSNYIPWKGYFDLISHVDEFIIFDDMQYTKRDWRNRNKIKTEKGLKWMSVPVQVKGKYHQKIRETKIDGNKWKDSHWGLLIQNYKDTEFFVEISDWVKPLYFETDYDLLSDLNRQFIEKICQYLNIDTKITNSWDYQLSEGKTERLADLCKQAGGTVYVSGPAAKDYIEKKVFDDFNIELSWFDYSNYPEYPQNFGDFSHNVTILDLLFNCGNKSHQFMKYISV